MNANTATSVVLGPYCAACNDDTCTAPGSHHTVTEFAREGNTMNAQQAADVIGEVAQSMGADVYAPSAWGDRDSSAYAVVLSPHHCVVMVNTDDLMDGYQITAYKYATPGGVVTRASQVMPALVTEDGDSVDPTGSGTADVASGDVTAATRAAIHAAFGA